MTYPEQANSLVPIRIVAAVAALPVLAYAGLQSAGFFSDPRTRDLLTISLSLSTLTLGSILLWFALGGASPAQRRRIAFAVLGGCIVGGIAFIAGFAGPLLFWPDSNQGPLIGIFVTGPLGFVAGCLGGTLLSGRRARAGVASNPRPV